MPKTAAKPTEQLEALKNAVLLPRDRIRPNPEQPREYFEPGAMAELSESIKDHGILQPLVVRYEPSKYDGTPYILVAGERRYRASDNILEKVPCIIRDVAPELAAELALVENIQREDLKPLEEAQAVAELMSRQKLSTRAVARKLKVSEGWVNNRLSLLKAGDDVKEVAATQEYSMSSLLLVDKVDDPEEREELLEAVKSGAPHKAIKTRYDAYEEKQKRVEAANHAPDPETEQRARTHARTGGGNVSRGEQVKGPTPQEAAAQLDWAIAEIERQVKHLKAWKEHAKPKYWQQAQRRLQQAVGGVIDG